jgi:synaptobrevin family protein YKT6
LERGEKLDSLVDRSNALSAQSKMFYKTAKKVRTFLGSSRAMLMHHPQQNSCCVLM